MVIAAASELIKRLLLMISISLIISSCHQKPAANISFYYWKTVYKKDTFLDTVLQRNNVSALYLRYFDLVWHKDAAAAVPDGVLQLQDSIGRPVVPVLFIRNEVFEHLHDSLSLDTLVVQLLSLTGQISKAIGCKPGSLQTDCDWTEHTAKSYFLFLRLLRQRLDQTQVPGSDTGKILLSATIRLHQVKYPDRTGIPPVDRGMLMYYNMGRISNSNSNSIYDRSLALKYLPSLAHYPLPLDMALPVFVWGIHIRNGQVLQLLNGTDGRDMEQDHNFIRIKPSRYKARAAFFRDGFYFRAGDEVKIEETDGDALLQMAEDINRHYGKYVQEIVFYDLDSHNISRYDPHIFKKTARNIN